MPNVDPVHDNNRPTAEAQVGDPPQRSDPEKTDLEFANMLAATIRQQAQSTALRGLGPAPNRFQQLAFLNQPADSMFSQFMAKHWLVKGAGSVGNPSTEAVPPAGAANALPAPVSASLAGSISASSGARSSLGASSAVGRSGRMNSSPSSLPLDAFPRPENDNGRGIHWIPTPKQLPAVIDRYVQEAVDMGIKWVTFLNDGTDLHDNDYLVKRLVDNGIEPVMRLYTDGGAKLDGDIGALVRHYKSLGVDYYQLYNEPNLRIENQGRAPDPKTYVDKWLADARAVIAAGGYPGFGSLSPTPGMAPGAAPGDMDDLQFLRQSVREIKRQGALDVLGRSWLSVHNYGQNPLRVREYDRILQEELGRSMPQIGTEAGIYPGDTLSQEEATDIVADAYRYLPQREDYYFAYTYWIIANDPGQGAADSAWNHQSLFRPGGESPLVDILKQGV